MLVSIFMKLNCIAKKTELLVNRPRLIIQQLYFCLMILLTFGVCSAEKIVIKAGFILDVNNGSILTEHNIIIEDGKITDISKVIPNDAQLIDLSESYILPGLIDMHTHLVGVIEKSYFSSLFQSPHRDMIGGVANAKTTLMAGFTSVRNVGAPDFMDVALRNAIDAGEIPGPRMRVSGPSIGITGGHCDNNYLNHSFEQYSDGVADGPWEIRKKVRNNVKYGVDLIKFCATGGVFSHGTKVGLRQYTLEEMKAIINEAHDRDRKVAAHAHGNEGIRYAILAGVDSIEHATFLDKETAILARENNVTLAMDIYNTDYTQEHGRKNGVPEANIIKDRETGDSQRNSFRIAVENNVNLVYATDSGVYPHGDNAKQFPIMVKYGMTPIQAIRSATIVAAELLDSSLKIGQIKPGYLADIIAVNQNPLEDITTFETITFVMKDGKIYKQLNQ